ncbi:MAG: spore maturation protein [Alphaproteobacteria bacterium]|nr:spore maturation protein [Alphaproteobacteria bacterium]MBF0250415.1 spore maturation protein [Alphaproteobacteria bacterium]
MNAIFFGIVAVAFVVAAYHQIVWDGTGDGAPIDALGKAMIDTAGSSVTLALGLVGVMTLFLGLMKVGERAGLLTVIARLLRPLMTRLFPGVPADHPAMGAMIMNIAANVLGLGNAATPFGIRAMEHLDRLNPAKGTASDAMILFLAINTSSVTLLPTGVIAIRAAAGSMDPAGIVPTTLFATLCSTTAAILMAKFLARTSPPAVAAAAADAPLAPVDGEDLPEGAGGGRGEDLPSAPSVGYPAWVSMAALGAVVALVPLTILYGRVIAPWIVPGLMMAFLGLGVWKRVPVYEAFIDGAKDGFDVALRIIPYLVAILVAVGMFRASGAMDLLIQPLGALTQMVGMPPEALPMALLRPLSGSGAYGIMASIIQDPAIGPDSYAGYLVSTIQGSTETTFYVLAVYFGAVRIRRIRYALGAALTADFVGVAAAVFIVSVLYG